MIPFKNIINWFLITCIIISNTGVMISLHYCEGSIKDISLFEFTTTEEPCCGDLCCETSDEGCCNSKTFIIEKELFNFYNLNQKKFLNLFLVASDIYFAKDFLFYKTQKKSFLNFFLQSNAPPFYLLFHQFIFYQ